MGNIGHWIKIMNEISSGLDRSFFIKRKYLFKKEQSKEKGKLPN